MKSTQNIDDKIYMLHKKAEELLLKNINDEDIITALIKEGIEPGYAAIIIENVKSDLSDKKNFWVELFKGIGIMFFSLLLNYLSYISFIKTGSGFWILYIGIFVFGITIIFRAFIIFRK